MKIAGRSWSEFWKKITSLIVCNWSTLKHPVVRWPQAAMIYTAAEFSSMEAGLRCEYNGKGIQSFCNQLQQLGFLRSLTDMITADASSLDNSAACTITISWNSWCLHYAEAKIGKVFLCCKRWCKAIILTLGPIVFLPFGDRIPFNIIACGRFLLRLPFPPRSPW